jgi:hypothetical protein
MIFFSSLAFSQTITQQLVFGAFIAGNGGTVSISSAGSRSASGGVVLLTGLGRWSPATVFLGTMAENYGSLTLPANGQFSLLCSGSAMQVKNFNYSMLTKSFSIGATLVVSANQKPCVYIGEFPVTINFQ